MISPVVLTSVLKHQLVQLENHYDSFEETEASVAAIRARTLQLEAQLAACHLLPAEHPLHRALAHAATKYYEYEHTQRSEDDFLQSKAIWSGISLWFTRQLGPIPGGAVKGRVWDSMIK